MHAFASESNFQRGITGMSWKLAIKSIYFVFNMFLYSWEFYAQWIYSFYHTRLSSFLKYVYGYTLVIVTFM